MRQEEGERNRRHKSLLGFSNQNDSLLMTQKTKVKKNENYRIAQGLPTIADPARKWARKQKDWQKLQDTMGLVLQLDERKDVSWTINPETGNAARTSKGMAAANASAGSS